MSGVSDHNQENAQTAKEDPMALVGSSGSAETRLLEKLKQHFNHTKFKSKLQQQAIQTVLKREFSFLLHFSTSYLYCFC